MVKRRNTPATKAVLNILQASKVALSQDAIEQEIKGLIDRVTVYRVLNRFCEDGYVHKILSDEGKYYFAICINCKEKRHRHNHFHFRCLKCQKVECLKEEVNVKLSKGYKLKSVNCILSGFCQYCS